MGSRSSTGVQAAYGRTISREADRYGYSYAHAPVNGSDQRERLAAKASAPEGALKAIVRDKDGSPDVLDLRDIDRPGVDDDSVLVRVRAASVNAFDWHMMRGQRYLVRISEGLRKPKTSATGVDLAGQVETVGKNVTQFRPGDEVFGERGGAFAEYVCAREINFAPKPANLTVRRSGGRTHGGIHRPSGPSR